MSAQASLYQTVLARICAVTAPANLPLSSNIRLALLISGMLLAKSCVLAQLAEHIFAAGLTAANAPEHVERRLRRTLNDPKLLPATCYAPLLSTVLDWSRLLRGSRRVVIAVDESSCAEHIHLLRAALCYWGGSIPLAWVSWPQNQTQPVGHYWQQIDALFEQLAPLLPPGVEVVIVADRAYAVSNFIDRARERGWHYVLRIISTGSHRYQQGADETYLSAVVSARLSQPGQRWQAEAGLFKGAGWRTVRLFGWWRHGQQQPLVVVSDLELGNWRVLRYYEQRFWVESGFRNDKSKGWQWESSQVRGVEHHERLLLAMAWASMISMCVGLEEAQERLAAEEQARVGGKTSKPRGVGASIFTLGLRQIGRWVSGRGRVGIRWRLEELDGASWQERWQAVQALKPPAATLQQSA